jgi:general secretion pathway protein N
VAGRAELLATDLSSRLSTLKPMGSYRITLVGGNTATLEVTTIEGSLQLAGTGRWVGSRLRFEGTASAAPEREAALANLLNIIGRRTGPRVPSSTWADRQALLPHRYRTDLNLAAP